MIALSKVGANMADNDYLCFHWRPLADENWTLNAKIKRSQVVYSKQPKLGLTQEFVVDCAHALWWYVRLKD